MAEADQGGASGNGAAPTAPAPTEANVPQAQGAPVVTKEVADYIQSEIAKGMKAERDAIFAEARRTFTEKRNKPKDEPSGSQPAAQAPDPHEERRVLRDFDRTISRLKLDDKISPSQWSRAEKALLAERPDDVSSWVSDYFAGFGAAAQPTAPVQPAAPVAPPKPVAEQPLSSRGAPPASSTSLEEIHLPSASDADRQSFIQKKGMKAYVTTLRNQLKGTTVVTSRR